MRILINNRLEDATITPDDASDAFPISDIISDSPGDRGQFSDNVVIDLGSIKAINAVGFLNSSAVITLEGNISDSWGAPLYSKVLTESVTFIDETFRYWRITTPGPESRLGYFYLGEYLTISEDDGTHNLDYSDTDIKNPTSGGSMFPTPGIQTISESYNFPIMSKAERANFLEWHNTVDRVGNHLIVPFEDNLSEFPPYFGNVIAAPFNRKLLNWVLKLNIIEVK